MSEHVQRLTLKAVTALAVISACPALAETPVSVDADLEFPAETAVIVAATAELFQSLETGSAPERRTTPVIQVPQLATKAAFDSDAKVNALTGHGPVQHLTGYRISWYPVDRFLGSVDFMGTWDGNRNLVCGYVTWDLSNPEQPELDTVTANFVDLSVLEGQAPSDIHEALLEANCAYGAVEANYTLFDPAS